ncbi:hypothetical protein [Salinarimonas ramus]|uniref:Uncharacterized protein n=1 Tax=Salinarimonas ramus TaxID=690164 RepID=A0A917Q413_9HYPH|nr:hypothetical protein [Salinarimonas ramus]GGK22307.1 hypothetical protein GCM10011322_06230 [Salinarimonas ramus]
MTRPPLAALAALLLTAPVLTPAALADDPPAADGRSAETGTPTTPDLPRSDTVIDAMPLFTGSTTQTGLDTPGLGDRPTPAEARRSGEIGETLMRPRGGSASGGKPDIPPER